MKIFMSVAGPDRSKVEEVALALKDEGHKVFLDEYELPAGSSYHLRIREAIAQADLAVFFISPLSVQTDRYTLSELKLIQDKWSHPRGRVLPTLIAPTDLNKVPAYLRAVTIYKPKGNVAAEVAYEVSRMRSEIRRGEGDAARAAGWDGTQLEPITRGTIAALGLGTLAMLTTVHRQPARDVPCHMGLPVVNCIRVPWCCPCPDDLAGRAPFRHPRTDRVRCTGCWLHCGVRVRKYAITVMPEQLPALDAGKSMIFALFAALALPGFRSVVSWASLAALGLIAGTAGPVPWIGPWKSSSGRRCSSPP